jgi:site-specific DNA-methyltransferase (adenine-specific)
MIICGDCLEEMAKMESNSIDSIVTDPPYGLSFMGKDWDYGIPGIHFWVEALRVAKPGCHLLAFGGTRTFHRLACAIEDSGWEIRDCLGWIYGSGFPKSHNLKGDHEGLGTALKPAWEPIIMARKPLDGTVAANVQKWGTGAINVYGCRVGTGGDKTGGGCKGMSALHGGGITNRVPVDQTKGRWPANLIHDGSDEVMELFPQAKGSPEKWNRCNSDQFHGIFGKRRGNETVCGYGDSGSSARFFYCAKASRKEREMGMGGQPDGPPMRWDKAGKWTNDTTPAKNNHPTVKPLALMRYLCRLVTPPNGLVLDPFMGSGTAGIAAKLEGFNFIGIDISQEYCGIATKRIAGDALKDIL